LGKTLTYKNSRKNSKKKLRADESQGVLAVIQYRIFCLPVCY